MADPEPRPEFGPRFREGVEHFNALEFWHAHESWEELWLAAESDLDQYLQGLIQLAAAYHHVRRGTLSGGVRLFDAALARLAPFPDPCCGIGRRDAERAAIACREWARGQLATGDPAPYEHAFPKLSIIDESFTPPRPDW